MMNEINEDETCYEYFYLSLLLLLLLIYLLFLQKIENSDVLINPFRVGVNEYIAHNSLAELLPLYPYCTRLLE